jgi:hypothetical protein
MGTATALYHTIIAKTALNFETFVHLSPNLLRKYRKKEKEKYERLLE